MNQTHNTLPRSFPRPLATKYLTTRKTSVTDAEIPARERTLRPWPLTGRQPTGPLARRLSQRPGADSSPRANPQRGQYRNIVDTSCCFWRGPTESGDARCALAPLKQLGLSCRDLVNHRPKHGCNCALRYTMLKTDKFFTK